MENIAQINKPWATTSSVVLVKADPKSVGFGKLGSFFKQD